MDYVIHVPRSTRLNHVNNINGTLRIFSSESLGDLHTVNGNIEIYESSGDVHAHTTNGNIYVELKHASDARGASAETTNGSVLLAIPVDMPAELDARCMNGSFSSELPLVIEGSGPTTHGTRRAESWRRADPPGNGQWHDPCGGVAVNGLGFCASKG